MNNGFSLGVVVAVPDEGVMVSLAGISEPTHEPLLPTWREVSQRKRNNDDDIFRTSNENIS